MTTIQEALRDHIPIFDVVYGARDFPTFFDAHLRRLREKFPADEYNDLAATAVAIIQIHLMSYGLSQLSFNLDRVAADCYLVTSRTLKAATRHTEQLGYKIRPAAASSGDFTVAMDPDDVPVQGSIAKGHRFQATGSRIFQATDQVIVPPASSSVSVGVTQGEAKEISFTSDGSKNQIFTLPGIPNGKYLAGAITKVYVNGELWEMQDFLTFEQTNQYKLVGTAEPPEVKFGDGFAGNIPPNGADVFIQYRIISGRDGNISAVTDPATTTITSVDPVVINGVAISVTVTAPNGTSGGDGPQDLDEVKALAPASWGSRGVAVTTEDYQALVNSFQDVTYGAVAQGYAADVRNTGNDAITTNLDASVRASVNGLVTSTTTKQTTLDTASDSLTTERNNVSDANDAIGTENTTLASAGVSVLSLSRAISASSAVVNGNLDSLDDVLDNLDAEISGAADVPTMLNYTAQVRNLLSGAAGIAIEIATIQGASSSLASNSETINAATTEITTQTAAITTALSAMDTELATIDGEVSTILAEVTVVRDDVVSDMTELLDHLDDLFDSDCKANVVQVPILAVGADGFYTGPSSGLIAAVQRYLSGIKEVTQYVNVISGAYSLLAADITIRVRISNELIEPEVLANIESTIDDILKDREFNQPLRLSAPDTKDGLYDLMHAIDGIEYVNIEITGPAANLDSEGNLIPAELQVITKGTVTIQRLAA